jgi:hypothetical protein
LKRCKSQSCEYLIGEKHHGVAFTPSHPINRKQMSAF